MKRSIYGSWVSLNFDESRELRKAPGLSGLHTTDNGGLPSCVTLGHETELSSNYTRQYDHRLLNLPSGGTEYPCGDNAIPSASLRQPISTSISDCIAG